LELGLEVVDLFAEVVECALGVDELVRRGDRGAEARDRAQGALTVGDRVAREL
jgi:hypothetical protein